MKNQSKLKTILVELIQHLPFSIFGVGIAIIGMGFLTFGALLFEVQGRIPEASEELFDVFHATHILFSAVATTAMFWKHEKRVLKALVVGFVGSIAIGTLSDILFPFVGGNLLGTEMHMHIAIIEEPFTILPFAIVGVGAGFFFPGAIERSTEYSHSAHVIISSAASILYLMAFGLHDWIHHLGGVFLVTIVAVMIPCCLSDIAFPLCCVHRNCKHN